MTLDQALAYLETTARVSCPQITCEQAAEIEAWLSCQRQHIDSLCRELTTVEKERDEALAKLREVERERDDSVFSLYEATVDDLVREREDRETDCQVACGFAWDAGRRMARLEQQRDTAMTAHGHLMQAACGFAWDCGREMARLEWCVAYQLELIAHQGREFQRLIVEQIEVGEDCDASDYERPGR